MTDYTHNENEAFVEVEIGYVRVFNHSLGMGQHETRAIVLLNAQSSLLASKHGVKIIIYPNDHSPPHFHVLAKGHHPAFSIETGERANNSKGLEGKDRQIKTIWEAGRHEIRECWNKYRPGDIPGQIMEIPSSWPMRDVGKAKSCRFTSEQMDEWRK